MGRPKKLVDTKVEDVKVEDTVETVETVETVTEVENVPEVEETVDVVEETPTEEVKDETPEVVVDDVDPTVTYGVAEGRDASDYVYEEPTITVRTEPEGIKVQSLSDLRHNNPRTNVVKASRAWDGASGVRISTKVAKLF